MDHQVNKIKIEMNLKPLSSLERMTERLKSNGKACV